MGTFSAFLYGCWINTSVTQVSEAEVTEKEIDETRERYRPVAYRGAIMYFCIRDFNVVDPMYQYSLQWFTNLFVQASDASERGELVYWPPSTSIVTQFLGHEGYPS